jgi:hypothetical protein
MAKHMISRNRAGAEGATPNRRAPAPGLRWWQALVDQARALGGTIALSAGVVLAAGVAVVALSQAFDTQLYDMTADPNAVSERPFAVGMLSLLAVMAWSSAAATCFAGAAILSRIERRRERSRVLLLAGALSAVLAADDAFMLHEEALPEYLRIPELAVYGLYGVLGVLLVHRARALAWQTEYLLALLAAAAMGASIAVDVVLPFNSRVSFAEDMLKFSGTVLWAVYTARASRSLIVDAVGRRRANHAAAIARGRRQASGDATIRGAVAGGGRRR